MPPVTVELNENDVVAAQRLYSLSFLLQRATLVRLGLIWLATTVFLGAMVMGGNDWASGNRLLISLGVVGAAAVPVALVLGVMFVLGPRSARKVFREQASLHGPVTYSWDNEGLQFNSEFGENRIEWNMFHHWVEDDTVMLFFEGPRLYRMVPKRVLDAGQVEEIRTCLRESNVAG
jgi:hypothetical protein